jgi:SAM-dependent methyltransferase
MNFWTTAAYWQGLIDAAVMTAENKLMELALRPVEGLKLNLGCCDSLIDGFVNVDVLAGPGVTVADLRERWPWPDDAAAYVVAAHVIEHLPDKVFTMNELWRVLKNHGLALIAVPTTDGTGAWQDPTHVSYWNQRSFLYYETGSPYREQFARHYGINAAFRTVWQQLDRTADGTQLTILLEAVKP